MDRNGWKSVQFNAPLNEPPRLLDAGFATHGVARATPHVERFRHRAGVWAVHGHTYQANLRMCGHDFPLCPGTITLVAPETMMEFQFEGRSSHFYALFQLCENPPLQPLAALRDFGANFEEWNTNLGRVAAFSAWQPRRAEAILWSLLWELADLPSNEEMPIVTRARREIESRLGEKLSVALLAKEHGLSHNQFTRVFRDATGNTPSTYIARRRLERAHQLLIHTTRPVKSIAMETGFTDIQALSKGLKKQYGGSPRTLRRYTIAQ